MFTYVHIYVYGTAIKQVYVYIYMCLFIRVPIYVHIYIYIHMVFNTYIYVYVYIYTRLDIYIMDVQVCRPIHPVTSSCEKSAARRANEFAGKLGAASTSQTLHIEFRGTAGLFLVILSFTRVKFSCI